MKTFPHCPPEALLVGAARLAAPVVRLGSPDLLVRSLSAAAFVLLASWLLAAEPKPVQPKANDEMQEFVFLAEARPLLVRLHVRVDDKPLSSAWDDFMRYFFAYLDLNGDGVLNKDEIERAPRADQLVSGVGNSFGSGRSSAAPKMDALDTNKDGKVSLAELSAYYRKSGLQPFQFQLDMKPDEGRDAIARYFGGSRPEPEVAAVSKAIFALLDSDHDGKLTPKELEAAPVVLLGRDENEDEIVTTQEVVPEEKPKGDARSALMMMANSRKTDAAGNRVLVPITVRGEAPPDLVRRLRERYDPSAPKVQTKPLDKVGAKSAPSMSKMEAPPPAPKPTVKAAKPSPDKAKGKEKTKEPETKLTRKQLGLEEAMFARLDTNKDGVLDGKELPAFVKRPPDLCLTLRLGDKADPPLDVAAVMGRPALLADQLHLQDGLGLLDLGATRMEVRVGEEKKSSSRFLDFVKPQFSVQFKQADKDNNGYLDEKEAKNNPLFNGAAFKQMDRDGDGKLYEKEMLAYFDRMVELQQRAAAGCVTLVLGDQSRGLFDVLDRNRDGRLSVREIKQAPKVLAQLDRRGQGYLTRDDIPPSYQLTLRRGPAEPGGLNQEAFFVERYFGDDSPETTAARGPAWFRKMDRNRDGDVSRKEFLFSDELFRKLDTDGDGLISLEEASAAGNASPRR